MPPSKLECKVISIAHKVKGEAFEKIKEIRDALTKLSTLKSKIRFGLVDIADAIGAEVISAIASVASNVAKSIFGNVSKIASTIAERIMSMLMTILLAFPTAVFSLASIPHDSAKKATERERLYLGRADGNLRRIVYIIMKWTKGKSGLEFREKMLKALPFIIKAINETKDLIRSLKGDGTSDDGVGSNSVFKQDVYNRIRSNLSAAISISKPESVIEKRLGINRRIEIDRKERYNKKASSINKQCDIKRRSLSDWYRDEISKISPSSLDSSVERLSDSANRQRIDALYKQGLDDINAWKTIKLSTADIEAETEALVSKDVWLGALVSVADAFLIDMRILQDELFDFVENIKNAYLQNKLSQLHCNSVYDSRKLIHRLISEMIGYMRSIGNNAGDELADAISSAQSLMEIARDSYQEATEPGSDLSSSEYAISLSLGHGVLVTADTILNSSVTDSLVDLINADDILTKENDEFDDFILRLASIKDWDGVEGVWAVDIINGAVTPYIQLIANATEMLAKVPVLSVMNKESDKTRVRSLVNKVRKDFDTLFSHNSQVMAALVSYSPYSGSEIGDLKKILSNAGLLETFATTMSMTALLVSLQSEYPENAGSDDATYSSCRDSYPELFEDGVTRSGASESKLNIQDPILVDNASQTHAEEKANDRMALGMELANTNFTRDLGYDDSNLLVS